MSETKARPWEGGGEGGSFGTWLRRQREAREISLREIAETSKISLRYLEALEQDRFEVLPAPLFAKGFLREYAKFVGLDPDEVVNYYLSALPAEEGTDRNRAQQVASPGVPWTLVAAIVGLAAVLAAALWYFAGRADPEGEPPTMVAPERAAPAESQPAPERASKPILVTLDFTQNSWVDAFVDGTRTVSELRVQGESLRLEGDREVRFRVSNPEGVNIEVNGRPFEGGEAGPEEYQTVALDDVLGDEVAGDDPEDGRGEDPPS